MVDGVVEFCITVDSLRGLSFAGNGKSLLVIVDLCISPFNSVSLGTIYFEALFGMYTFRILVLSWWMDPLILT